MSDLFTYNLIEFDGWEGKVVGVSRKVRLVGYLELSYTLANERAAQT